MKPILLLRSGKFVFPVIFFLSTAYSKASTYYPHFLKSRPGQSHISTIFTLYGGVVRILPGGDLVIAVPKTEGAYKIRFYDQKLLLFEIRQIRDRLLIVEKYNFQHAGVFRYELYRDNTLVEKNEFILKRDKNE